MADLTGANGQRKDFKVVDYETIDQALAAIDEFFKTIEH